MRYRLRALLIVLALGPPVLAGAWLAAREIQRRRAEYQDLVTCGPNELKPAPKTVHPRPIPRQTGQT
jgi:hypothetical protein